jgi:hypothetical protein
MVGFGIMSDSQQLDDAPRLDRSAFSVGSLSEPVRDWEYWLSRSPEERFQEIERLRLINYGDLARGRLQRFLEVAELKRD